MVLHVYPDCQASVITHPIRWSDAYRHEDKPNKEGHFYILRREEMAFKGVILGTSISAILQVLIKCKNPEKHCKLKESASAHSVPYCTRTIYICSIHYMAKPVWTPDQSHLCVVVLQTFATKLVAHTNRGCHSMIEFPFAGTQRPKPVPAWHKKAWRGWCEKNDCPAHCPWPQSHKTPFGMTWNGDYVPEFWMGCSKSIYQKSSGVNKLLTR